MSKQLRIDIVEYCYHRLGWSFVPLVGKKPIQKEWSTRPRESLIEALKWAEEGNIGLRTGQASNGTVAIDIDAGGDVSSLALPETVQTRTGSGQTHLLYRSPREIRNSAGKLFHGVDIRGDGGQIVLPGSIHPITNEPYLWVPDHAPWNMDLADLPECVFERLAEVEAEKHAAKCRPASQRPGVAGVLGNDRYTQKVFREVVAELGRAVEGERNETLNRCAFRLGQFVGAGAFSRFDVEEALREQARALGLGNREIELTIRSGLEGGMKEPAVVPEPVRVPVPAPVGDAGAEIEAPTPNGEMGKRDPKSGRLILSPVKTKPTAMAFFEDFYNHADGRTLLTYGEQYFVWRGNRYREIEADLLRCQLVDWLHEAVRWAWNRETKEWELVQYDSNPTTVEAALKTIRHKAVVPIDTEMPCWLDGREDLPAREITACKTVLLHLPTRKIMPGTPKFFSTNALDYDPDLAAPPPKLWLRFLNELWPEDSPAVQLLQEWFGYCLTPDTSQQKMLYIVGPRRSGKGTILRVLTALIGQANVASPSIGSLAGEFGTQCLLGKTVATVTDARWTGRDIEQVVERLLRISGEDSIDVNRKYLPSLCVKLPTRFTFCSNELPKFMDSSNALSGRFVLLQLTRTFYGEEDLALTSKLLCELPGILNWAIEGWMRLRERGAFVQPPSGEDALREMEELSSPVGAFIRDKCRTGRAVTEYVETLYEAWRQWCLTNGRERPGTVQSFGRELAAVIPGLRSRRNTAGRYYEGVCLLTDSLP